MKKRTVWIITWEWELGGCGSNIIWGVYKDYDKAISVFKQKVEEDKKGWSCVSFKNKKETETERRYEIYEDGFYREKHGLLLLSSEEVL